MVKVINKGVDMKNVLIILFFIFMVSCGTTDIKPVPDIETQYSYIESPSYKEAVKNSKDEKMLKQGKAYYNKAIKILSDSNVSDEDKKKAKTKFVSAYLFGKVNATYQVAMYFLYKMDHKEARLWLNRAIVNKVYDAFNELAAIKLLEGDYQFSGTKPQEDFSKAAVVGNAYAYYHLGVLKFDNNKQNNDEAMKYFSQAADLGCDIAACYKMQYLVNKIEKAEKYEIRPNILFYSNNDYSAYELSLIRKYHYAKMLSKKDQDFIKTWQDIDPEKKNIDNYLINYTLGMFYRLGYFGEPNYKRAWQHFERIKPEDKFDAKSFIKDYVFIGFKAQYQMGMMYYQGIGVEKNINKAKEIFEKAIKFYDKYIKRNMHGKKNKLFFPSISLYMRLIFHILE